MKKLIAALKNSRNLYFLSALLFATVFSPACKQQASDKKIKQMDPATTAQFAASIESLVKPVLTDSLTLRLWGVDSLVISPVAIDIDDFGKLYYTTTNRSFPFFKRPPATSVTSS